MDREKMLADELAENNDAIDAFQLYADTISIGRSEFNVLNSDGFYDALAYFLATMISKKEIALKVVFEWWESLDQDTIDALNLNVYDLVKDWLDKED